MDKSEEFGSLVVFTALAPMAVGGLLGLLIASGAGAATGVDWSAIVVLIIGVLALVISLFHLGRPWRAPLALIRLTSSWLSREVLFFGLYLAILTCYALLPLINAGYVERNIVGGLAVALGLVGLVATGKTYRLHARPSWDQWTTILTFPLGALSTGTLFGLFIVRLIPRSANVPSILWALIALLLVSTLIITWLRSIHSPLGMIEAQLSRQLALGSFRWLLVVRLMAVVIALVLVGVSDQARFFAWIPALLGELADRVLFFKTVVPVTFRGRYL